MLNVISKRVPREPHTRGATLASAVALACAPPPAAYLRVTMTFSAFNRAAAFPLI